MSFDLEMTQFLTGVTKHQLWLWSKKEILVPEINASRPMLYSFRDIVAVRVVSKHSARMSLQNISCALGKLKDSQIAGHCYVVDGESFCVEDAYFSFINSRGKKVPELQKPAPGIEIDAEVLGGTPRAAGSRIPTAVIAELLRDPGISEQEIQEFYPNLKTIDLKNIKNFDSAVYGAT